MNLPPRYGTAAAFRIALETRLKSLVRSEGADLQRLRRQVSFDRLLARLFHGPEVPWLLKGGYAMELRLRLARATKDIDLSLPGGGGRVQRKFWRIFNSVREQSWGMDLCFP